MESIVGHTYKFQVKFTPFNFTTATRQTFTVTQILEEVPEGVEEANEVGKETDPPTLTHDDVEGSKEAHDKDDNEALDIKHKDKRLRHE